MSQGLLRIDRSSDADTQSPKLPGCKSYQKSVALAKFLQTQL